VIRSLEIRGLVVIEHAELVFGPGLTVITGETGAGKTVLTNALGLLGGMTADATMVRPGHTNALIQATIAVSPDFWDALDDEDPALGLRELADDAAEFIVTRRIPADGRSRSFVDGAAVPHAAIASLVGQVVRFSGQGDQRLLTAPRTQMAALDRFIGPDAVAGAAQLARLRKSYRSAERARAQRTAERERIALQRADLEDLAAQFAILAPLDGEVAQLAAERDRLRHADRLARAAAVAAEAVAPSDSDAGARDLAGAAEHAVADVVAIDPLLAPSARLLGEARTLLEEAALELRGYLEAIEADPGRLDAIESRLADLDRIARRAGCGLDGLGARWEEIDRELAAGRAGDDEDARFAERQDALHAEISAAAVRLTADRVRGADDLAAALTTALADLAMPDAAVRVVVRAGTDILDPGSVQILLQPNAGLPEAPLSDVASGGELSRILLALHGLSAGADDATWVFDEIDAGIGGVTAGAVARRLAELGRSTQTIVITHLAQVAAVGDAHLVLDKGPGADGMARTAIRSVDGEARVSELCRMLGAPADDPVARQHAIGLMTPTLAAGGRESAG
jgi:DNA repair protein RecN (Recombination protein N)